MGTKLFDRIATLIKADAHGLLESLEERSLLLKQYLREAELELDRKRARLEMLRGEGKRLQDENARCEAETRSLDEDIRLALRGGKEDVARFAIRRLIPKRNHVKTLQARIAERRDECDALEKRLHAQAEQFEELKRLVHAELARRSEPTPAPAALGDVMVADEEVELELLRRRLQDQGGTR